VYLHNTETYNLLMKVDSNTKGSTYWFCFKVQNFRVGVKYTFTVWNFTRSMDNFYRDGMNIAVNSTPLKPPPQDPAESSPPPRVSGSNEIEIMQDESCSKTSESNLYTTSNFQDDTGPEDFPLEASKNKTSKRDYLFQI
jgi:hypothetical protein